MTDKPILENARFVCHCGCELFIAHEVGIVQMHNSGFLIARAEHSKKHIIDYPLECIECRTRFNRKGAVVGKRLLPRR